MIEFTIADIIWFAFGVPGIAGLFGLGLYLWLKSERDRIRREDRSSPANPAE